MKLRALAERDAADMLQWMHDDSVVHFMGADFASKTLQDCNSFIESAGDTERSLHLAIVDDKDCYMGTVSLKNINRKSGCAEFAITVCKEAMGRGYSAFAMREILRIGLEKYQLNVIYWYVSKKNKRAVRFYDKNGYQRMDHPAGLLGHNEITESPDYLWYMVLLESDVIMAISNALGVDKRDISNITILKKGMTNSSFLFECQGRKYIMRVPGQGTDRLINRKEEAEVYQAIADKQICDDIIFINPENGYKITEYLQNARVCDPFNMDDIKRCMCFLRKFHELGLETAHYFDIFGKIDYYESLWGNVDSAYSDYLDTKKKVFSLKSYITANAEQFTLTHIDAVSDNFLFTEQGGIRLIDWEYAGMQDPHVDIAMFCIYSLYDRSDIDRLIDLYFEEGCPAKVRIKIYCYIAACGLLWSNWCEYKRSLGEEFDRYAQCQYRYAVDYSEIARRKIEELGDNWDA